MTETMKATMVGAMTETMKVTMIVAFVLCVVMVAVWWLFGVLLRFSLTVEAEELRRSKSPASYQVVERIGVLRSLETILHTIFAAIIPLAGVVLGMTMPAYLRTWLGQFIGPGDVVAVILTSLFAYFALFVAWRRHEGPSLMAHIMEAFFGKKSRT